MLWELVRKDLKLFTADRTGMVISLAVPIALASFMALIFGRMAGGGGSGGGGGGTKMNAVAIAVVDLDGSAITKTVVDELKSAGMVEPRPMALDAATDAVRTGRLGSALVLPAGFGSQAPTALFSGDRPEIRILYDPSKSTETQIVRGALMQSAMQVVSRAAFDGSNWEATSGRNLEQIERSTELSEEDKAALRELFGGLDRFFDRRSVAGAATAPSTGPAAGSLGGMREPFTLKEEPLSAASAAGGAADRSAARRATVVHAFVGMTVQAVLFFAIDAAMGLLRDRNRGIWRRFRAAPVGKSTLLAGRAVSGTMIAAAIAACVLLFGAAVFGVRVSGSAAGFLLVFGATALMASTFGLLIATLGRNENQSRAISIFVVLAISMLGGAWFPSFLMPRAIQHVSVFLPSRWAVEGMDAMTWRGLGFGAALAPAAALLAFSAAFALIAWTRFRWDAE